MRIVSEPWLTIIGLGEDGLDGLSEASRSALSGATAVFGGPRHLALAEAGPTGIPWPVPFDTAPLLERRGLATVALVSGDPFWFGAGSTLAEALDPDEWRAFPGVSTYSLAAAQLGWRLEHTTCLGLHATSFAPLRAALSRYGRAIALLRDGSAPAELAAWLEDHGFGAVTLHVLEALGGPRARVRSLAADRFDLDDIHAPVAVAIDGQGLGPGAGLPRTPGLPDDLFDNDGQLTKRPIRALTLSALAPRAGEMLWDLGAGSGSVAIEWCLAGGRASAVEAKAERAERLSRNVATFGLGSRIKIYPSRSEDVLPALPAPDAVFVGGGGSEALFAQIIEAVPPGCRLVANAVALETETLLISLHATHGGTLHRFETAEAQPLGGKLGWTPARAIVQWSVTL